MRQTDGEVEGQKKWHKKVGVPPKNYKLWHEFYAFFLSRIGTHAINGKPSHTDKIMDS